MTTDTRLLLAWSIFAIMTFLLFATIHKKWREKDVWNTLKKRYIDTADAKKRSEAAFAKMYGTIENTLLYYRMDRLILTSGIRKYLPWLTGERYLLILAGAFLAGIFEGIAWKGNLLVGLFLERSRRQSSFSWSLPWRAGPITKSRMPHRSLSRSCRTTPRAPRIS